jgi:hypothetical protein
MNDDIARRAEEIQASMLESAKSCFDEAQLGHLRAVIRITVEFHDYLEHGSVAMALGIQQVPYVGLALAEFREDLLNASADPFNKYDLEFACESILSGVDSFWRLSPTYSSSDGAKASRIEWGMISSKESLKSQFVSMFKEFTEEVNFENKCRLLLDLFKLQIIFVGISYG